MYPCLTCLTLDVQYSSRRGLTAGLYPIQVRRSIERLPRLSKAISVVVCSAAVDCEMRHVVCIDTMTVGRVIWETYCTIHMSFIHHRARLRAENHAY